MGRISKLEASVGRLEALMHDEDLVSSETTLRSPQVQKHIKEKKIQHIALALAKFTYFGKEVLTVSTITGREEGSYKLDPEKLSSLKSDVRRVFNDLSPTEFELLWKGKAIAAIANYCRTLRKKLKRSI